MGVLENYNEGHQGEPVRKLLAPGNRMVANLVKARTVYHPQPTRGRNVPPLGVNDLTLALKGVAMQDFEDRVQVLLDMTFKIMEDKGFCGHPFFYTSPGTMFIKNKVTGVIT